MNLALTSDPIPLHTDESGTVRVGGTRVTLGQIVQPFRQGVTPEEIALRHPTLDLGAVYATVAYYLRHRASVEAYLAEQTAEAERARNEHAEALDMSVLRERLLARRQRA